MASTITPSNPKIGGGAYRAPKGTTLPTDATTSLGVAFKALGHLSEDGITSTNSPSYESVKAWGGVVVYSYLTEKPDVLKFKMLNALDTEVLKTVYGDSNVSGTLATGITVKVNAKQDEGHVFAFDMVLADNTIKRIVVPNGIITSVGDVAYKTTELIAYDVELTCNADSQNNTHYEYIINSDED